MSKKIGIFILVLSIVGLLFLLEYTVLYLSHPTTPVLALSLGAEQDPTVLDQSLVDLPEENDTYSNAPELIQEPDEASPSKPLAVAFSCPKPKGSPQNLSLTGFPLLVPIDSYIPLDLVVIPKVYTGGRNVCVTTSAYKAFTSMRKDMQQQGLLLRVYYGFRDNDLQESLNATFRDAGKSALVAPVGQSEHVLGTAFDFTSGTKEGLFGDSPEYIFLRDHGYQYGFVQSFQGDLKDETHISVEPWHWRYVGVAVATAIKHSGLPVNLFLKSY
jgi:LAS superfamily LD-carboxypeptidase LdcB